MTLTFDGMTKVDTVAHGELPSLAREAARAGIPAGDAELILRRWRHYNPSATYTRNDVLRLEREIEEESEST